MTTFSTILFAAIMTFAPLLPEDIDGHSAYDQWRFQSPQTTETETETETSIPSTGMEWFDETVTELQRLAALTVDSGFQQFGLACWEDEVIVLVVSDPYNPNSGLVGQFGCVPADNLPTNGNRP